MLRCLAGLVHYSNGTFVFVITYAHLISAILLLQMKAFVTVGTTRFDDLIDHVLRPECLKSFKKIGVTSILLQIGASDLRQVQNEQFHGRTEEEGTSVLNGISIKYYCYKPSILQDLNAADLVIGHAGAGTVLECMKLRKRLVVVINEKLMNNHQAELAVALAEGRHAVYCVPFALPECLLDSNLFSLVPFNPPDQKKVADFINKRLGVVHE